MDSEASKKSMLPLVARVSGLANKYSGRLPVPGTNSVVFSKHSKSIISDSVAAGVHSSHAS